MKKNIPTTKYLSKYVKHLFGVIVTFKIIKGSGCHHDDFASEAYAITYPDGRVENFIEINEQAFLLPLPWWVVFHEIGHLQDKKGKGLIEREYNAQMFAMKEANKRKYYKVLQLIFEFTMDWKERKEKRYTQSAKLLLGEK